MKPAGAALIAALPLPFWATAAHAGDADPSSRPLIDSCTAEVCQAKLTAGQLLVEAQKLVNERRFDEARPMVDALKGQPGLELETRYLNGFIAVETGDYATAAHEFRSILADDPSQTRVRLELARVYLHEGKTSSADHHFKLAQADATLPPDIARVVRNARDVIRSQRSWTFNVDVGIAPDTNINNATDADRITLNLGNAPLNFTLDESAKAQSGTGQTATIQAGLRLPVVKKVSALLDVSANGTNYKGSDYDDFTVQLAAGPELRLSETASVSVQGLAAQRWYGGSLATRQAGGRLSFQKNLSSVSRMGLQLDARHSDARFNDLYNGWQVGLYGSYERVVTRTVIASGNAFVRRDWTTAKPYSSIEYGGGAGLGAELPYGFNAGANFSISRAIYDAPIPLFSEEARKDWRLGGKVTVGNRKLSVLGFSPSFTWSLNSNKSAIDYFSTDRSRFRFGLARYF